MSMQPHTYCWSSCDIFRNAGGHGLSKHQIGQSTLKQILQNGIALNSAGPQPATLDTKVSARKWAISKSLATTTTTTCRLHKALGPKIEKQKSVCMYTIKPNVTADDQWENSCTPESPLSVPPQNKSAVTVTLHNKNNQRPHCQIIQIL